MTVGVEANDVISEGRLTSEKVSSLYYKAQTYQEFSQEAAALHNLDIPANSRLSAPKGSSVALQSRGPSNLTFAGSGGPHQPNRTSLPDDRSELEPLDQD